MASRSEIFEAADRLVERGERPTLAAVRAELGGGSYTTISEAMKGWKAAHEAAEAARLVPAPEGVRERALQLAGEVWDLAQEAAGARLDEERQALAAARRALEAETREAAETADELALELDAARAALALAQQAGQRLTEEGAALGAQLQALRAEHERVQARAAEAEAGREAARSEARAALTQAALTAGRLEEASTRATGLQMALTEAERRAAAAQAHAGAIGPQLEAVQAQASTQAEAVAALRGQLAEAQTLAARFEERAQAAEAARTAAQAQAAEHLQNLRRALERWPAAGEGDAGGAATGKGTGRRSKAQATEEPR